MLTQEWWIIIAECTMPFMPKLPRTDLSQWMETFNEWCGHHVYLTWAQLSIYEDPVPTNQHLSKCLSTTCGMDATSSLEWWGS